MAEPPAPQAPPTEPPAWRWLRWFALAAVLTNVLIVFTGGVVRVTGSGLGCIDWPTCDGTNIAPRPGGEHAGWQSAVEFGNRLLTFPVLLSAVAVFTQVRRTRPHPPSVEALAWALPLGVLGQALLGGVTVLTGLSPWTVAGHFLLSMALIAWAVTLHDRVRVQPPRGLASRRLRQATTAILVLGAVVLVLGTAVTGAGPHGGDLDAPRFGLDIRLAARYHALAVWLLVGTTVATLVVARRDGSARLQRVVAVLLLVQLAQGGIGYVQYWTGIPPTLVSLHILGAAVMWAVAVLVWVRARPREVAPARPATGQGELTAPHGAR